MRMSDHGRDLLAEWEGLRLHEYLDAAGLPTIGVGHLITSDEVKSGMLRVGDRLVSYSAGISREDAMELLDLDIARFEEAVSAVVLRPLSQSQFDALVSFAFNVGIAAFVGSSLLRELNLGRYEVVPTQLLRWANAGGQRLQGLVRRRESEGALWEGKC